MARFPLFGTGQKGRSVHYTAQRRVNLYCDIKKRGQEDRTQLSYHGTPGLTLFHSFGDTPCRGALTLGETTYVVHGPTLYSMNNAGSTTVLGALNTSSGRVDMATNGTELMVVDGTNGYIYEIVAASYTGEITDAQFPDAVNTVTYQAGRFIYDQAGTGQFGVSASYDGTAYDGAEIATAESLPDDLVRVHVDHGEVILFGAKNTEFWQNVGALDFPYAPIQGAAPEYGLAARWSVAKFVNTTAFLAQNSEGQVTVVVFEGYQPRRISTDELDYIINGYSTVIDASGFSYNHSGHSFYQLNFPTAGKSWLYDNSTRLWSELEYGSKGARHRGEFAVDLLQKTLVFDYENGNVYRFDPDVTSDNGEPITREIVGRHIIDEETITIGRLWVDIETGLSNSPQAMLSVSKDGGHNWGTERWVSLGAIGQYRARAVWRVLGQALDWVFRIRISGATKCTISGAWVDAQ